MNAEQQAAEALSFSDFAALLACKGMDTEEEEDENHLLSFY
jgi:hypothetical protein